MRLSELLRKRQLTIVGINSGTSLDSLDLAAIECKSYRSNISVTYRRGKTVPYDKELRERLINLIQQPKVDLSELISLDQALGVFIGRSAARFISSLKRSGLQIDAIASHGQTVKHLPEIIRRGRYSTRGSLQLGSPEQISSICNKVVVSDMRQADIAVGGEGAPITSEAVRHLLAAQREDRLVVNIGGMANYFFVPSRMNKTSTPQSADSGPGNILSDLLCQTLFDEPYDSKGKHALNGTPSTRLLTILLRNEFFSSKLRSTGREHFGVEICSQMISFGRKFKLSADDLVATASELTVVALSEKIEKLIRQNPDLRKLYLTGGGVHNNFFMRRLKRMFNEMTVESVKVLGFDPDLVEAMSFGVIGYAALRSLPLSAVSLKGSSKKKPVLGRITQPPEK